MLSIFIKNEVKFMVVGAYALGAYVKPRSTGDIDLWVEPSANNAPKVLRSIAEFGAPLQDLTELDLQNTGIVFQIGLPPLRIDIITKISGVTFEEAWKESVRHKVLNMEVPIISKKHIIQNKKASGRPKDLLDVEDLMK
jgi:hypothetical protein